MHAPCHFIASGFAISFWNRAMRLCAWIPVMKQTRRPVMNRIVIAFATIALFSASPAIAGGSVENPDDKKAPVSNKSGTDNPPKAGQHPAEPAGQGAPVPKDAAKGTSDNLTEPAPK
jgi:hypothetical protein